jgi:hypothetical protein
VKRGFFRACSLGNSAAPGDAASFPVARGALVAPPGTKRKADSPPHGDVLRIRTWKKPVTFMMIALDDIIVGTCERLVP